MRTTRKPVQKRTEALRAPLSDKAAIQEIDRILAGLETEIPEAQKNMDALLDRIRRKGKMLATNAARLLRRV